MPLGLEVSDLVFPIVSKIRNSCTRTAHNWAPQSSRVYKFLWSIIKRPIYLTLASHGWLPFLYMVDKMFIGSPRVEYALASFTTSLAFNTLLIKSFLFHMWQLCGRGRIWILILHSFLCHLWLIAPSSISFEPSSVIWHFRGLGWCMLWLELQPVSPDNVCSLHDTSLLIISLVMGITNEFHLYFNHTFMVCCQLQSAVDQNSYFVQVIFACMVTPNLDAPTPANIRLPDFIITSLAKMK